MIRLFQYIREVLGVPLSDQNKKDIALLHPELESFVVPSNMGSVVEYIDELVLVNNLSVEDKEELLGKINQYMIMSLDDDRLYILILKHFSTKSK